MASPCNNRFVAEKSGRVNVETSKDKFLLKAYLIFSTNNYKAVECFVCAKQGTDMRYTFYEKICLKKNVVFLSLWVLFSYALVQTASPFISERATL